MNPSWQSNCGKYRLYHGDSYKIAPLIRGEYDSIVSDPPYKVDMGGGGFIAKRKMKQNFDKIKEANIHTDFDGYGGLLGDAKSLVTFLHQSQLQRLLNEHAASFDSYCLRVWHKTNPMPFFSNSYQPEIELILHFWQKGYHPQGDNQQKKRVIAAGNMSSEYRDSFNSHPTIKPEKVMDNIIVNAHTQSAIFDPFMGSGSTGVACVKFGKPFIGIENNEKFFNIAVRRIENALKQGDFDFAMEGAAS